MLNRTVIFWLLLCCSPASAQVERIWLGHRSNDPSKLVVNWMTKEPGDSVVRFGRTAKYGHEVRVANDSMVHHAEIPLAETGGEYHYSVSTGKQVSRDASTLR